MKIKEKNRLNLRSFGDCEENQLGPGDTDTNHSQNCVSNLLMVDPNVKCSSDLIYETWFTSPQAAEFLGISVQALMNKVSGGKVPFYKFGRRNRYKKSELEKLFSEQRKGPFYGN